MASSILVAFGEAPPAWWGSALGPNYGIYDAAQVQDNWAVVNIGQLKNITTLAKAHVDATLGTTSVEWNAVYGGTSPFPFAIGNSADNYAPANAGQLKYIALGFYKIIQGHRSPAYIQSRLGQMGVTTISVYDGTVVPWTATAKEENYGPAMTGQLKAVFSFDLSLGTSAVVPAQLPIPAWMRADLAAVGAPYGTAFTVNGATMESPGATSGPVRLQVLHPQ